MASARCVVTVLDHGVEVETGVRRPIRMTPDGFAGVAYAGSVYPLHSGDVIELSGSSWELADCERFLFAGADIPYASAQAEEDGRAGFQFEWYLETNQYGHYVVFNAPERVAGQFVAALESAGVGIQRWDVSHRPADDGNFYDWFARLRFKGPREAALEMVRVVVAPPAPDVEVITPVVDPLAQRLGDAEERIEQLLDKLFGATKRAEAAERQLASLRSRLEASERSENGQREALALATRRHADLQAQIATLRNRIGSGPDTVELVRNLADAEELRELALAENSELLDRTRFLESEGTAQRERADGLADQVEGLLDRLAELEALETERKRAAVATRPRPGGVVAFLAVAFGRLEFVLDAVDVIASLEAPAATMRALSRIDAGELIGKDLEGMRGWFAVTNLATGIPGSQRLGRIYYKPDGDRVLVSVHIKQDEKQQRRHLERLRNV